jgi:hypothetical protein
LLITLLLQVVAVVVMVFTLFHKAVVVVRVDYVQLSQQQAAVDL